MPIQLSSRLHDIGLPYYPLITKRTPYFLQQKILYYATPLENAVRSCIEDSRGKETQWVMASVLS